jgi:hypothetical protein
MLLLADGLHAQAGRVGVRANHGDGVSGLFLNDAAEDAWSASGVNVCLW